MPSVVKMSSLVQWSCTFKTRTLSTEKRVFRLSSRAKFRCHGSLIFKSTTPLARAFFSRREIVDRDKNSREAMSDWFISA